MVIIVEESLLGARVTSGQRCTVKVTGNPAYSGWATAKSSNRNVTGISPAANFASTAGILLPSDIIVATGTSTGAYNRSAVVSSEWSADGQTVTTVLDLTTTQTGAWRYWGTEGQLSEGGSGLITVVGGYPANEFGEATHSMFSSDPDALPPWTFVA